MLRNYSNLTLVTSFSKKGNLKKQIGKVHESKKPFACHLLNYVTKVIHKREDIFQKFIEKLFENRYSFSI
jgi:hypothetical protein